MINVWANNNLKLAQYKHQIKAYTLGFQVINIFLKI